MIYSVYDDLITPVYEGESSSFDTDTSSLFLEEFDDLQKAIDFAKRFEYSPFHIYSVVDENEVVRWSSD